MLILTTLPWHVMMVDRDRESTFTLRSADKTSSSQLDLDTHWKHLGLSRFIQVLKNSLLFISSDFNEVLLVVNSEVPLLDDLLQGICILLNPKNCSKRSVKNYIGLGSLSSLRKMKEEKQSIPEHTLAIFSFLTQIRIKTLRKKFVSFLASLHLCKLVGWGVVWSNASFLFSAQDTTIKYILELEVCSTKG